VGHDGGVEQDVSRFVSAQDRAQAYERALAELRAGHKQGHWIWFVLPQLAGLGTSGMSREYGIRGLAEARAYLTHPVLGPRLRECAEALTDLAGSDPVAVMGGIDAVKLRSSMTLFARAAEGEDAAAFRAVLEQYFGGEEDPHTLARL
jgi:uncharacterized protein (DUF1810 family)